MTCRFAITRNQQIPQLGGPPVQHSETNCQIKMQSQEAQLRVYDRLFQLGLESSMLTNVCPVAHTGRWDMCPLRQ